MPLSKGCSSPIHPHNNNSSPRAQQLLGAACRLAMLRHTQQQAAPAVQNRVWFPVWWTPAAAARSLVRWIWTPALSCHQQQHQAASSSRLKALMQTMSW
jgi:hypothetical protein